MLKQAWFLFLDVTVVFWGGYRERVSGNTKMCTYVYIYVTSFAGGNAD